MKLQTIIILLALSTIYFGCSPSLNDLKQFAAVEHYPSDNYLDTISQKRALIIVAHDDDDCTMSGTISKLFNAGWKIKQFSFEVTPLDKGRTTHPSEIICDGNAPILQDRDYRNGLDTTKYRWMPVPKNQFDNVFKKEKVINALIKKINDYNPTVIFTLDNEIGGYGNPEHIFISQLVLDLSIADSIHPKRIYQGVYTDHMEKEIIEKWLAKKMKKSKFPNPYLTGKKIYNVTGMPKPDVEIDISAQAKQKMEYLRSYSEDARKNIRKFMPYYEDFDSDEYFTIFNREFFRIFEFK